jgi:hypothetical protein
VSMIALATSSSEASSFTYPPVSVYVARADVTLPSRRPMLIQDRHAPLDR